MIETVSQPIAFITVKENAAGMEGYTVGNDGITKIDITWKPLALAWWGFWRRDPRPTVMTPFVRVWRGETCVGDWSQHRLQGIYFAVDQAEIDALIASDPYDLARRVAARAANMDAMEQTS